MRKATAELILKDPDRFAHHDRVFLNNPVVMQGMGLAPLVVLATTAHNGVMLAAAVTLLLVPSRVLACLLSRLFPLREEHPANAELEKKLLPRSILYSGSAAVVYLAAYPILNRLFGVSLLVLGIYLPIMVVEPAIVKRMEFADLEPVKDAFRHGFNNALGMCIVLLIVGCLRELLATGAVFGNVILHNALLPLAALPAGGFVIVGILAAIWCAAANLYTDYKHEEVRRLYADRKH